MVWLIAVDGKVNDSATIAPHFFQDVKAPSEFKADGFVVTSVCLLESERVK